MLAHSFIDWIDMIKAKIIYRSASTVLVKTPQARIISTNNMIFSLDNNQGGLRARGYFVDDRRSKARYTSAAKSVGFEAGKWGWRGWTFGWCLWDGIKVLYQPSLAAFGRGGSVVRAKGFRCIGWMKTYSCHGSLAQLDFGIRSQTCFMVFRRCRSKIWG